MAKDTFRRSYCVSVFFPCKNHFWAKDKEKKIYDFERKQIVPILLWMYINIYICALLSFSFWLSMCKYCTVHLKDTFKKKNCFFYEGKKIECSLTHTYVYKYMYVYLYIYIHTYEYISCWLASCWLLCNLEGMIDFHYDWLPSGVPRMLRGKFWCSQIEYGVAKLKLDDGPLK